MKQHLTKLKNILQHNYIYVILGIIVALYILISTYTTSNTSIYKENQTTFKVQIEEYKFSGNQITLELKGKESLIGTYYIKSKEELETLKENIKYGITIKITGKLNTPQNNTIPNTFNYKKYLINKKIYYTIKINKIEIINRDTNIILRIKNTISSRINKIDKTGYLKAFILGNKDDLNKTIYSNYQKLGISHLLALSGMHISLLCNVIMFFTKKLNISIKYIVTNTILIIYGYIVGYPSSIKRCITFFLINSINKILKLNISSFKILLLTTYTLIIFNYKIIYDIGFLYSAVTVGGILINSEYIKSKNKYISAIKLSMIAFIFSLPITLYNYHEINILSIIYNIFFIPLISTIIYPLSLLTFIIPTIYPLFNGTITILEKIISILSEINIANLYLDLNIVEIIIYYTTCIFIAHTKKYKLSVILFLIIIADIIIPHIDSKNKIYFLDVKQGDSTLIVTKNQKTVIMIDTGGIQDFNTQSSTQNSNSYLSSNTILFMKSNGIKKIDYLILTHGDYDHMGEAINLVENYKIEKVIFNCGKFNELEQELIKVLEKREIPYFSCIKELTIDDNKLYFLNNKDYGNENDNSSVIYTKLNNHKILLMGDAGVEVEGDLIEKYNLQNIDVLKVGHHGSKTSSSKNFIDEINPKYSIISVGKNNRYGHPNKEVLENLYNSKVYRTDQDGSIMFKIKNNKLQIQICEP